jgi:NAD dependent epimerase/dehydratase family enzyme
VSLEPEQLGLHKVLELIDSCPIEIRRLLEQCYVTIYEEDYSLPPLFGTVYIPDEMNASVVRHWNCIDSAAKEIGVALCHVKISVVFKYRSDLLKRFRMERPRHYLNLLYLKE